jgi:hypothetical protein
MLTKAIEVTRYVRASAGRAKLNVQFENVNQPRHDGDTIYLPRITAKTTEQDLLQLMASTDHEVAHDRFSSFTFLRSCGVEPNTIGMFVFNIIEDFRVNHIEGLEYKGFQENWDVCCLPLLQNMYNKAQKEEKDNKLYQLITNITMWGYGLEQDLFLQNALLAQSFTFDPEFKDVLDTFVSRYFSVCSILDKELGSKAAFELSKDILKALGKECPKKMPAPSKESRSSSAKTGTEATKNKDTATACSPEDGKLSADPGKESDEDYKVIKIKVSEEDLKGLSLSPITDKAMGKVGSSFDSIGLFKGGSSWEMTDYSKFVIIDYPNNTTINGFKPSSSFAPSFINGYKRRVADLEKQENIAQQIRKLIQIRAKVQTQFATKKGKLDQSRIARICFKAPGFSDRVFKNKIENKTLDAAVTVLMDLSGSMGGEKLECATAASVLMNEVCTTLGIPLEILGFTDGAGKDISVAPWMYIYKGFSDLKVSSDDLLSYVGNSSSHMLGNPDGENILWAYDRLLKRKEKKRIYIVMSDGSPAASRSSYGLADFTLKVIREIEQAGKVHIMGLGLCTESVQTYYKHNKVVNNARDIAPQLLSLFEREIIG